MIWFLLFMGVRMRTESPERSSVNRPKRLGIAADSSATSMLTDDTNSDSSTEQTDKEIEEALRKHGNSKNIKRSRMEGSNPERGHGKTNESSRRSGSMRERQRHEDSNERKKRTSRNSSSRENELGGLHSKRSKSKRGGYRKQESKGHANPEVMLEELSRIQNNLELWTLKLKELLSEKNS